MPYVFGIILLLVILAVCLSPIYLSYHSSGGNKGKEIYRKLSHWGGEEDGPTFAVIIIDKGYEFTVVLKLALSDEKSVAVLPYIICDAAWTSRDYAQAQAAQWSASVSLGEDWVMLKTLDNSSTAMFIDAETNTYTDFAKEVEKRQH